MIANARLPAECSPSNRETRLLGARVDWLTLGYRTIITEETLKILGIRQRLAENCHSAELRLGDLVAKIKRTRAKDRWAWQNGTARGIVDLRAGDGWITEVTLGAEYLSGHTLKEALSYAHRLAGSFGLVQCARLQRLDLAADYMGWPLLEEDARVWLTPRRGRMKGFEPCDKDTDWGRPRTDRYWHAREVTGFTICPGNTLMCRVYDKTAELKLQGRQEKREIEFERWTQHGWTAEEKVTRVEFQVRGEALTELELRSPPPGQCIEYREPNPAFAVLGDIVQEWQRPEDWERWLPAQLDSLWQYCTTQWTRLVIPEHTRLDRCPIDPRWIAAQETKFVHQAGLRARTKSSGGASFAQAFGTTLSSMGALGKISPLLCLNVDLPEATLVSQWTDEECETVAADLIAHTMDLAAQYGTAELLLNARSPRDVALTLLTRIRATRARHFISKDLEIKGGDRTRRINPAQHYRQFQAKEAAPTA